MPTPTMTRRTEAWQYLEDEHQSLAAIVHAVHFLLDEIAAGRIEPDFRLLRAMVYYLTEYPERRHHPNEDHYLFARLKERTHEADAIIARLEREHAAAEQRIAELESALHAFASREPGGFERFRSTFERYAQFYRQHMLTEEREILPLAQRHLREEDWAWIAEGWRRSGLDPMRGTTERDDWMRIFERLVRHAPPPLGLGEGPYPEAPESQDRQEGGSGKGAP